MAQDATLLLSEPATAQRQRLRATYASLGVAGVLIAAKLVVWISTGSVALLSSLVDFLVDSAVLLMFEAARRLVSPAPVQDPTAGIAVMVFSIIVTLGLVTYQRHVVRHTGSLAIGADELHYRSDLALNLGVIATLAIGSLFRVPLLDPLFGGAVGLWIIYSAAKIARLSLVQLMDQELPDSERARVRAIAESHPDVTAVHDIRTRVAGPTAFIQLHLEMDAGITLLRAH